MKLHFYMMKTRYNEEPQLVYAECEVIEKAKTYRPADRFPDGVYNSYIKKENIGHISGYGNSLVVLTEKNTEKAKEIFSAYYEKEIRMSKEILSEKESLLSAVNAFEG